MITANANNKVKLRRNEMLFAKNERKKRHPIIKMMIGGFAAIGACTVVSAAKSLVRNTGEKISSVMSKMMRKGEKKGDSAEGEG